MLSFTQVPFQRIQDHPEMFFIPQKIGVAYIHENSPDIVLTDIVGIGLLYIEQVSVRDRLFVRTISLSDILLQFTYRGMEINEDIRMDQLGIDNIEKILVQPEFLLL